MSVEAIISNASLLAIACICACYIITGVQVYQHLSNYTNPYCQDKIISNIIKKFYYWLFEIVILLFAPFFALCSSLTIWVNVKFLYNFLLNIELGYCWIY